MLKYDILIKEGGIFETCVFDCDEFLLLSYFFYKKGRL